MRKKDGTGRLNLSDFRLYYKAIVLKGYLASTQIIPVKEHKES